MSTAPCASASPAVGGRFGAALEALRTAVDELQAAPAWQLSSGDLGPAIAELAGLVARITSVELGLLGEAHDRAVAGSAGASSAVAWLRSLVPFTPQVARDRVRVAQAVRGPDAATGRALAAGDVSFALAAAVTAATAGLDELPPRPSRVSGGVDEATRSDAETLLLAQSLVLDPGSVRRVGRHLLHVLDPDGAARLASDHHAQVCARTLSWMWQDDGMLRLSGVLDAVGGATFVAALDPLAAPHTTGGIRDHRSPGRRRADALVQLVGAALDGQLPPAAGGERAAVVVTMDLATLCADLDTAGVAAGSLLGHEQPVPAAAARRLACDARVIPMLLGSAGEPLDVGRSTRTWPAAIRRAVHVRDRGCVFPGCDRPPGWCQIHHIVPWSHGGPTALSNAALLCDSHHDVVHHTDSTVRMGPDGHPVISGPGQRGVRGGADPPAAPSWRVSLAELARRRADAGGPAERVPSS